MRRVPIATLAAVLPAMAAASVAWSCASAPAHVPISAGSESDLSSLVGRWAGSYTSPASGRSGSIVFHLVSANADSAFGDVVMVPRGSDEPLHPVSQDERNRSSASPQLLAIRFVEVREGTVSGTLQPYREPDCACALYTTFTGTIEGDRIEGTFVTTGVHLTSAQRGTWSVRRTRRTD